MAERNQDRDQEYLVVLRVMRKPYEDEPQDWDWNTMADMDRPDGVQVIDCARVSRMGRPKLKAANG